MLKLPIMSAHTRCGGVLQEVWQEVLRCVSRWELLQQVHSGGPTDALLFAQPGEAPGSAKRKPLSFFSLARASPSPKAADLGLFPSCLVAGHVQHHVLPYQHSLTLKL